MLSYLFTLPDSDNFIKNNSDNSLRILEKNFRNNDFSEPENEQKKIILVGNTSDCIKVVESLGQMPSYFDISIINLGHFKNTSSNFKVQALSEVLEDPSYYVVLLSDHSLNAECYKALANHNSPINPAFISNSSNDIIIPSEDEEPSLDDFAAIGIQKHLSDPNLFNRIEGKSYNFIRLGQLRSNFQECEVVLRNANYINFNLNVVKSSEMPYNLGSSHCGLTMEETCQLMKYVGLTPKLRVLNIEGINTEAPRSYMDKVATLLWYLVEAIDKKDELEALANLGSSSEFIISLLDVEHPLRFVTNNNEKRWWLSLPQDEKKEKLYACSEADYMLAKNNIISDRILKIMDTV